MLVFLLTVQVRFLGTDIAKSVLFVILYIMPNSINSAEDIKKSLYSLFNDGHMENSISRHKKKGSDIKAALLPLIRQQSQKKQEYLEKTQVEISHIGFTPDTDMDSPFSHLLEYVPKRFSYDMIYHGEKYVKTDNGIEEEAIRQPTKEQQEEMREYNKYSRKYMDACVTKIKLEALRNSLQDGKSYDLDIDQIAMLGL